jgi:hypothetical protein
VPGLTRPIIELGHSSTASSASNSIDGGFVYRGSAIPGLVGKYVLADLGQGFNSSAIFYAIVDPSDPSGNVGDVLEFKLSSASPRFEGGTQEMPERIFSIGEDLNGEIYLVAGPDPRQTYDPNRPSVIIRLSPKILLGDLNGDLLVTGSDWTLFKAGQGSNFAGLSSLESYSQGDLDGDFDHDLSDFSLFRTAYDQFNGAGSFVSLLSVPEPSSLALIVLMVCLGAAAGCFNHVFRVRY